jgi:hypothetical protein
MICTELLLDLTGLTDSSSSCRLDEERGKVGGRERELKVSA